MTTIEPIKLISDEALAELTRMADDLAESGRQYDEWCARHGYRRGSFSGRMERMYERDHAEAIEVDRLRDQRTAASPAARWSLGGYAQQYPWAQCRYCGRAQSHDCPVATCPLCNTASCFGRGNVCSICYHGFIPGWSRLGSERECGYKGCDRPAIAKAPRVKQMCAEHAKVAKIRLAGRTVILTDFVAEQVALRDAGKLAVGHTRWRWVQ